jgi:hypothetical protein
MSIQAPAAFSAGISKHLQIEYREKNPTYPRVFQVDRSDAKFVDMVLWQGYGLPAPKVPGVPGQFGEAFQSFSKRFLHVTYYLADMVTDEDWDDDKYGVLHRILPAKGGMMARSFRTHKEITHANLFNTLGFASGTNIAGSPDGVCLFSTTHPLSAQNSGVTFANRPTVDADLSITTAQAAAVNLRLQYAANGVEYIENDIRGVVINPALEYVAKQVFKGKWERGTTDRNENFLTEPDVDIIPWAYFKSSGATGTNNSWFVFGEEHYLYSFDRTNYKVDTDHDIYILATVFAAHFRYSAGWSDWRGTFGSRGQ